MNITLRATSVVLAASLVWGCTMTQEQSGGLLGGAAGAAAGSAIGGGSGRTVAIILGALVGSAVGANIGRHMDEQDRIRTAEAMEYSPTGRPSTWRNPDTQTAYTVTPTRTAAARYSSASAAVGCSSSNVRSLSLSHAT